MSWIALNLVPACPLKVRWQLKLYLTACFPIPFCSTNRTVFLLTQKPIAMNRRTKEPLFSMKKVIPMIRYPYGRTTFFKWLRDKKILQVDNTPYRQYIDRGYLKYRTRIINKVTGKSVIQPLATIKGLGFLQKLVDKEFPLCPPCNESDNTKSDNHE